MPQQEPASAKPGHKETHKSCVAIVPIFNHLEESDMDSIVKTTQHISLQKGQVLYRAGDQSTSLYIVHKGKIKVYRLSETGKEQVIRILNPGDFTGELALFKESIHDVFAEAMEKTEICSIQRRHLQEFLRQHPHISWKMLNEFSKRLEAAEHQLTSFVSENAETRIAVYLTQQAEESRSMEITLSMSRKDLAPFLGTTSETISRKLAKFEDKGWIRQQNQRKIVILDLKSLQRS